VGEEKKGRTSGGEEPGAEVRGKGLPSRALQVDTQLIDTKKRLVVSPGKKTLAAFEKKQNTREIGRMKGKISQGRSEQKLCGTCGIPSSVGKGGKRGKGQGKSGTKKRSQNAEAT